MFTYLIAIAAEIAKVQLNICLIKIFFLIIAKIQEKTRIFVIS